MHILCFYLVRKSDWSKLPYSESEEKGTETQNFVLALLRILVLYQVFKKYGVANQQYSMNGAT